MEQNTSRRLALLLPKLEFETKCSELDDGIPFIGGIVIRHKDAKLLIELLKNAKGIHRVYGNVSSPGFPISFTYDESFLEVYGRYINLDESIREPILKHMSAKNAIDRRAGEDDELLAMLKLAQKEFGVSIYSKLIAWNSDKPTDDMGSWMRELKRVFKESDIDVRFESGGTALKIKKEHRQKFRTEYFDLIEFPDKCGLYEALDKHVISARHPQIGR